jgi:hypothetical protein
MKKVKTGTEALQYLRQELRQGNDLAHQLLGLNLEGGEGFTFLPTGLSSSQIADFGESLGYLSGEGVLNDFQEILLGGLARYLHYNWNLVVFETVWGPPTESRLPKVSNYFVYSGCKYDFLTWNDQTSKSTLIDYILDAQGYPTIIVLTKNTRDELVLSPQRQIQESILEELARNAEYIIVGAFDGEGYLFWETPKIKHTPTDKKIWT